MWMALGSAKGEVTHSQETPQREEKEEREKEERKEKEEREENEEREEKEEVLLVARMWEHLLQVLQEEMGSQGRKWVL